VSKDSSNHFSSSPIGKRKFFTLLRNILGFHPINKKLYELAFTHKSASIELPDGSSVNNEWLEFLGDVILDVIISDYLFKNYADKDEGFLTKIRSKIVSRDNLNDLAEKVGIDQLLISNVNQDNMGRNLFGNAMEALIGAMYLDRGYWRTKNYVIRRIIKHHLNIEELEHTEVDFKSLIIEWAQKNKKEILFDSSDEMNPDNKQIHFFVDLFIDNKRFSSGEGMTKKEAEQHAAEAAIHGLNESQDNPGI
jgi:ribonuclease-3